MNVCAICLKEYFKHELMVKEILKLGLRSFPTYHTIFYCLQDGVCRFKKENVGATDKGYTDVTEGDEDALKEAVATVGPISVAIDASHQSFQLYQTGRFCKTGSVRYWPCTEPLWVPQNICYYSLYKHDVLCTC